MKIVSISLSTYEFCKIYNTVMGKNRQIAEIFIIPTNKTVQAKECTKYLFPPIFSSKNSLVFRNYDDCMHEVRQDSVRKLLSIDNVPTLLEISEVDNYLIAKLLGGNYSENEIIEFIKEWFDIDRDLTDFINY